MKFFYWIKLNLFKFMAILIFAVGILTLLTKLFSNLQTNQDGPSHARPIKITIDEQKKKRPLRFQRKTLQPVKKISPPANTIHQVKAIEAEDDGLTSLPEETQQGIIAIQKILSRNHLMEPEDLVFYLEQRIFDLEKPRNKISKSDIINLLPPQIKELIITEEKKEQANTENKTTPQKQPLDETLDQQESSEKLEQPTPERTYNAPLPKENTEFSDEYHQDDQNPPDRN